MQISFHSLDPFQVLQVCSELGLPLLQSYTLHHISSTLTSESVSRILLTSESLLESCDNDMLKVTLQRVHLDCISFIQTHTRTVFLSESFLLLPKETLITIISDNKVRKYQLSCSSCGMFDDSVFVYCSSVLFAHRHVSNLYSFVGTV